MRILLVESDPVTANSLEIIFQQSKLFPYTTDMVDEAVELARLYDYDLIITETLVAGDDAIDQLVKPLRVAADTTPILILSGDDRTETKIKAFGHGADDYLTKPFHREELLARIHAIVRRSQGHAHQVISVGKLDVDLTARIVESEGNRINLTKREYGIMELLATRKGSVLTKDMMINHLYGGLGKDEPGQGIIDVFMCKLRKKLSEATEGDNYIETVWGRGYTLREPAPDATEELTDA